jgi:hypothetical protein
MDGRPKSACHPPDASCPTEIALIAEKGVEPAMSTLAATADRIPEGVEELERLVLLLDRAGRQLVSDAAVADQVAESLALHSLGLAVFITQGQAVSLLPEEHVIHAEVAALVGQLEWCCPVALLEAAEEITRSSSLRNEDKPGLSHLVVNLSDLIREARGLDE